MITNKNGIPWELSQWVEEIKDSLQIHQYKIQHCYREANSVADVLAKAASNMQNGDAVFFYNWKDLPRDAGGCSRMDQFQMPNFRIKRQRKGNFL